MIPFDVKFYRAETVDEAVAAWNDAAADGGEVLYFGGGTEIVTLARDGKLQADRYVDYKRIPETRRMPGAGSAGGGGASPAKDANSTQAANPKKEAGRRVVWGSALRLNEVIDGGAFGLLGRCCAGIADRSVRNSITLGGNVCGMLPYREAVLPFLLLDGEVETVEAPTGQEPSPGAGDAVGSLSVESMPVERRFNKKLKLEKGELVLGFSLDSEVIGGLESKGVTVSDRGWGPVEAWAAGSRGGWFYTRKTREPRLDYPLVTLVLALLDGEYRLVLTGSFGYPLRAGKAEEVLNRAAGRGGLDDRDGGAGTSDGLNRRATEALAAEALDAEGVKFKEDIRGGREYRRDVTVQALAAGIARLAGGER